MLFFVFELLVSGCSTEPKLNIYKKDSIKNVSNFDADTKTVHVLFALCDNKYQ